ncbi:MAG: hypothetical protein R3B47_06740 [Bacteroidia bacterium]
MKFFLRWTVVLASLIMLSLASQLTAAAYLAPSDATQARNLELALDNMADKNHDGVLSEKEMKRRARIENRINTLSERIDARMAKREAKGKKTTHDNIRSGLIFIGIGLLLYILAAVLATGSVFAGQFGIASIFALLGWISILIGLVFLILGLVERV